MFVGHTAAPQAQDFCDCTAVLLLRLHRNCRSAGILFSVLPEKSMQKRGAGRENSAYAQKGVSFRCACFRYAVRGPNALRATVESGFRIARYICAYRYVSAR